MSGAHFWGQVIATGLTLWLAFRVRPVLRGPFLHPLLAVFIIGAVWL